jgi:RimJ/RimL family protein N-acetyltransferase
MKWTGQGRPDADVAESKEFLKKMLSPIGDEIYVLAITMADTGELVGTVGSHKRLGEFGWPVLGYMIRQEFWGKGIATEVVGAFLKLWWSLPREETEVDIRVEESTATPGAVDGTSVPECLVAITDVTNGASQAVLKKFGFKLVKQWYWVGDDGKVSETELSRSFVLVKPE